MRVGIFLSTIKKGKDEHLQSFAVGVKTLGDDVFLHSEPTYRECDIAVMLGSIAWKKDHPFNPAKKAIFDNHKGRTIHIDGHVLRSLTNQKLYRVSLDSVYPTTADFVNQKSPSDRWQKLGFKLQPWRKTGDHILLCLQRNEGWAMKGTDPIEWAKGAILTIRKVTDRKIRVRCHPTSDFDPEIFTKEKNVEISNWLKGYDIKEDLKNCWSTVAFNSSAALDPVVLGVPLFLSDADCLAFPVANTDLNTIETPHIIDRSQWCNDLAYAIWTSQEMKEGIVWKRFKERIEQ